MTREQLLATLTTTGVDNGWYGDSGAYVDWSTTDGDTVVLEAGDDDGAVQLKLTRDELRKLHRQLTLTLLADA